MEKENKIVELEELDYDWLSKSGFKVVYNPGFLGTIGNFLEYLSKGALPQRKFTGFGAAASRQWLARKEKKESNLLRFVSDGIEFVERAEQIVSRSKPEKILFKEIQAVVFRYVGTNADGFGIVSGADKIDYTSIEIETKMGKRKFYVGGSAKEALQVLDLIYNQDIPIVREFFNSTRVFKGRFLTYKEIQEVKKKYNIIW